jgi:hypothetical protein
MTSNPTEVLKNHLALCDEIHQLALEENRFLKQQQRPPDAPLLDKKRALLARLDESLSAIKSGAASSESARPDPERKETIEKARAKILQILHLDRENEQLLLRHSLGVRPSTTTPAAAPHVSQIQRLYDRHS